MSSRTKIRLALLIGLLALVTVPLGSMIAQAHNQSFPTNLTLHYETHGNTFDGHLGTANVCQDGRLVSIHEDIAGSPVVGTALSGHSGQYGPVANTTGDGTFFATVDAVDTGGYGNPVHCEAGVSHVVTVGGGHGH
jgi:hypothetical protein